MGVVVQCSAVCICVALSAADDYLGSVLYFQQLPSAVGMLGIAVCRSALGAVCVRVSSHHCPAFAYAHKCGDKQLAVRFLPVTSVQERQERVSLQGLHLRSIHSAQAEVSALVAALAAKVVDMDARCAQAAASAAEGGIEDSTQGGTQVGANLRVPCLSHSAYTLQTWVPLAPQSFAASHTPLPPSSCCYLAPAAWCVMPT